VTRVRRCIIFNPFFPVLGGGERYAVSLGEVIGDTHQVTYASPYGLEPERVRAIGFPPIEVTIVKEHEFPSVSADYDLAVVVALDVPPATCAARSILDLQFPRETFDGRGRLRRWWLRARLGRYHVIVNSRFAQEWTRRRWGIDSDVVYPPVGLADAVGAPKENLILAIGRFLGHDADQWNSKRQDALIAAFAELPDELRESWRLVLAGGAAPSAEMDEALARLRGQAAGLNIDFETNVSAERLSDLLARARFFWHASGFERPEDAPERAEHFGMATVEAMSAGAIPLVYADGGQLEIVSPPWGRVWRSLPELVEQASALMTTPVDELDGLGVAARAASEPFAKARFAEDIRRLLASIGADRRPPSRVRAALGRGRRRLRWRVTRAASRAYGSVFRA
jgi:glycosyltransferase involved in cell wall biosynthesis